MVKINFTCAGLEANGGTKTILNLAKSLQVRHSVTITALSYAHGRDHEWFGPMPCRIEYIEPKARDRLYRKMFLTPQGLNITYSDLMMRQTPDCDANIATYYPTAYIVFASGKGHGFYLIQHNETIMAGGGVEQAKARQSYALPLDHIYISEWVGQEVGIGEPVIGNGIDPNVYFQNEQVREQNTVLVFMRGASWKRDSLAITTLNALHDKCPGMSAIIVGCAPSNELRMYHELHTNVSEKAMAQLYRRASVLLSTSEKEGFGLPPLEAMACGTPVVANRYINAGHINSSTALIGETPEELAHCIMSMQDSKIAAPYIARGLEVAKGHDFGKVAERFESVMEAML